MAAASSQLATAGAARCLELLLQQLATQGATAVEAGSGGGGSSGDGGSDSDASAPAPAPVAQDAQGRSLMHHAVASGVACRVARIAVAVPASVNLPALDARTPIMAAAALGHPETVAALARAGALVNAVDARGCTALWHATWRGADKAAVETVHELLRLGADPRVGRALELPHGPYLQDLQAMLAAAEAGSFYAGASTILALDTGGGGGGSGSGGGGGGGGSVSSNGGGGGASGGGASGGGGGGSSVAADALQDGWTTAASKSPASQGSAPQLSSPQSSSAAGSVSAAQAQAQALAQALAAAPARGAEDVLSAVRSLQNRHAALYMRLAELERCVARAQSHVRVADAAVGSGDVGAGGSPAHAAAHAHAHAQGHAQAHASKELSAARARLEAFHADADAVVRDTESMSRALPEVGAGGGGGGGGGLRAGARALLDGNGGASTGVLATLTTAAAAAIAWQIVGGRRAAAGGSIDVGGALGGALGGGGSGGGGGGGAAVVRGNLVRMLRM